MAYNEDLTVSGVSKLSEDFVPTLRDYPIYNDQYYSGTDVSIYFGDTWVDEIVSLQFEMQEKVSPIFGYADYIYTHLARGSRTVYGKFRMNFTEAGYLKGILDRLSDSTLNAIPDIIAREKSIIVNQQIDEKNFEQFADYYEATIWGETGVDTLTFGRKENRPRLSENTFDIVIGYGAIPGTTTSGLVQMNGYAKPSSTLQIIKNVTLTGKSQIIDTSDNGLMEEYDFIAQDIL